MAKHICLYCGHPIEAPDAKPGATITCPDCGRKNLLAAVAAAPAKNPKMSLPPLTPPEKLSVEQVSAVARRLVASVEKVIIGKREQVTLAVVALMAEGHLLVEDVPGVAK